MIAPKKPRLPGKPLPPRGGIVGPVPPGQPMPPWIGVYPPGTIQNFRPLGVSWDETGRPGMPPILAPPKGNTLHPLTVALMRAGVI